MAILHYQLRAVAASPDGTQIRVPPVQTLVMRGPVVQVMVSVPPEIADIFAKESKPIPSPVSGLALIDTGATISCVDEEVVGF